MGISGKKYPLRQRYNAKENTQSRATKGAGKKGNKDRRSCSERASSAGQERGERERERACRETRTEEGDEIASVIEAHGAVCHSLPPCGLYRPGGSGAWRDPSSELLHDSGLPLRALECARSALGRSYPSSSDVSINSSRSICKGDRLTI